MDEYDYFMIRIRRPSMADTPAGVAGVVERIGTGEKRSFASGDELLRFMGEQGAAKASIRAGMGLRKQEEA